ncbi:MAG: hypothetical protein SGI88_14605 [Candidatus Hydrogenedentes bacterium]|nr:hypothetical protein [Candidatus Hydrogenedentota bacterium]
MLSEYTYDTGNRLTGARTGAGPWTTFGYADANAEHANTITGPDALVTTVYYDTDGLISKVTHPSVDADGTRWAYDGNGVVTAVTDPLDNVTAYEYDTVGNLTSVTDPNLNETIFTYDDLGNVTSVTDPRGA